MHLLNKFGSKLFTHFEKSKEPAPFPSWEGIKEGRQLLQGEPLSQLLPYQSYDTHSKLFINRESVGFVIEAIPLLGADEIIQKELTSIFQEVLEERASIQCLLLGDQRINQLLEGWASPRKNGAEIFQSLAEKRVDYFQALQRSDSDSPPRNLRFLLSYSVPRGENLDERTLQKLKSAKERILGILTSFTFAKELDAEDFLQFMDGLINFEMKDPSIKRTWNPLEDLSVQLPRKGFALGVHPDGLSVSHEEEIGFSSLQVDEYPPVWSNHGMQKLIGDLFKEAFRIPSPFYLHFGVHCPAQAKEEGHLNKKMQVVENQGKSSVLLRMIPELREELGDYDFVRKQIRQGEKIAWTQLSAGIWYEKSQKRKALQMMKSLFRINQFRLEEPKFGHLMMFLSSLPMSWVENVPSLRHLGFLKTGLALETGNFVPIQGEWVGTPTPGMLLTGRRGQVFSWSPFDNRTGNYNVVVVGRSGSGKSVFMQELLMSSLGIGAKVFVLDVGRSFEKMCSLLDGQYLEFTLRSPICLNPFTHLTSEDPEALNAGFSMIKSIVATMAAPQKGTTDLENALIEKAIRGAWKEKGNETTITDITKWLVNQESQVAQNLGIMLLSYTLEGSYSRFFEGTNNVSFDKSMVLIELEELKDQKDLQTVVLQMIMMTISSQTLMGDRTRPFLICIDEAWDLLRSPQTGLFIETLARRLRKYNGSLVIGTQSIDDFYQAPGALAAFENSDWMCLLSQKRSSISRLKESKKIDLEGEKETCLQSLSTKHGAYSEVMLCDAEGFYSVARLKLDPFSSLLYSTKAEEYAEIQKLKKQGYSVAQAIEAVLKQKETQ